MKSITRFVALAALTAWLPLSAHAATYYFSDCKSGAVKACVPGDDANDGLSPSKPKVNLLGSGLLKNEPGNVFRFARGGAWDDFSTTVFIPASTKDQPTVFEAYTPSWCTGVCADTRPMLKPVAGKGVFRFADGMEPDPDGGYVLRSLHLRGPDDGTGTGIYLANDVDDVLMEGLVVQGFGIGVYLGPAGPARADAPGKKGSDGLNSDVTLRNSTIKDNSAQGFLGGGSRALLEGNTFDNNGFKGGVRYHNVYLSSPSQDMIVRNNTLTRNALVNGVCKAVSLVAHGSHPRLTVEQNLIFEAATANGCWGIALDSNTGSKRTQNFSDLVIRGNRVVLQGSANQGISCSTCPNAVVENNQVVRLGEGAIKAIVVPSGAFKPERGDTPDGRATVRNNSIYIDAPSRLSVGVQLNEPDQVTVVSNLIVYGPTAPSGARCFATGGKGASSFAAFDANLCTGSAGPVTWSAELPTLAAAKAAGFDPAGADTDARLTAVPSLANGWLLDVKPGSRTINAGDARLSAPRDYTGKLRGSRPDIGAMESGGAARPAAPGGTTAQ